MYGLKRPRPFRSVRFSWSLYRLDNVTFRPFHARIRKIDGMISASVAKVCHVTSSVLGFEWLYHYPCHRNHGSLPVSRPRTWPASHRDLHRCNRVFFLSPHSFLPLTRIYKHESCPIRTHATPFAFVAVFFNNAFPPAAVGRPSDLFCVHDNSYWYIRVHDFLRKTFFWNFRRDLRTTFDENRRNR